jgi:SAM-dependent methyltransferase
VQVAPVGAPDRFGFGRNWRRFTDDVDEHRVRIAEQSLQAMLRIASLRGRSFLDVGCGSGLFSLAAARLHAEHVHSFDLDVDSVAATEAIRERFRPHVPWTVEYGDATDASYCESLGRFDVVYAWGVLHHTGAMWRALENTIARVADHGLLYLAIYNDQGRKSEYWRSVKRLYNRLPSVLRVPYAVAVMLPLELRMVASALVRRDLGSYLRGWSAARERGMSRWHDLLDWVGGYPFEVATPEEVFRFCRERGLELVELTTAGGGLGCNQFVFRRT